MPIYVWFLYLTVSFNADGTLQSAQMETFPTLSQCETAAYNLQDWIIELEKLSNSEGELHCVKHAIVTGPQL